MKRIEEIRERLKKSTPIDCGSNSCRFAVERGGMRTNGPCRCIGGIDPRVRKLLTFAPTDLSDLCEALEKAIETIDDRMHQHYNTEEPDCAGCSALEEIEAILAIKSATAPNAGQF